MPPKKGDKGPSKKTETKKKEKVIEDKTFGMKNKKGAKAQKFIAQVQKQVFNPSQKASAEQKERELQLKKKEEDKKRKEELNLLFKPVQTIGKGVDPKSVLCAFFKNGQCGKGNKCKFSHDLAVEMKTEKRSIYEDDPATVVETGEPGEQKGTSTICKHFLAAVEESKFGWFWECPTGERCPYKHALPRGYVLKKDAKKMDSQKETISLEELIERERSKLGSDLTKVTFETFLVWKQKKRQEKVKEAQAKEAQKKKDFKKGKILGVSGRDMFVFNPDLVGDDDEDADDGVMQRDTDDEDEEKEEEVKFKEINLDEFALDIEKQKAAGALQSSTITAAPSVDTGERFADINYLLKERGAATAVSIAEAQDSQRKEDKAGASGGIEKAGASGGIEKAGASGGIEISPEVVAATEQAIIAAAMAVSANADEDDVPIDENLFDDADLDDLEDLEEDLDTLEL